MAKLTRELPLILFSLIALFAASLSNIDSYAASDNTQLKEQTIYLPIYSELYIESVNGRMISRNLIANRSNISYILPLDSYSIRDRIRSSN